MVGNRFLGAMATVTAGLWAVAAFAGPLSALAGLQTGRWNLDEIGVDDPGRALCVSAPIQLIQLNHPGEQCQRYVIIDTAEKVTVQYTCQGRGYGRTTVSIENAQLIKLDTQGIGPDGLPFDKSYEGRRTGACVAR